MIRDAYRLVVPYVSGCPACADDLFTLIANEAIEEVHQQKKMITACRALSWPHQLQQMNQKKHI